MGQICSHCPYCNALIDDDGYEDEPPQVFHGESRCPPRLKSAIAERAALEAVARAAEEFWMECDCPYGPLRAALQALKEARRG